MLGDFRDWIRRHGNAVLTFLSGMAFGISVIALAFFSTRAEIAGQLLRYGVQATGHPDLEDDLMWLFCGIVIGGSVACLAWWRDTRTRNTGLQKADVLNRLFAEPDGDPLRLRRVAGKDPSGHTPPAG